MNNKTSIILTMSLVGMNHLYAQPPEPAKLFNYDENYFAPVNATKLRNVPFLIAVIPNKIRIYRPDQLTYKQSNILDSLVNDSNFRIKDKRPNYKPVINLDSTKAMLFVQGITKKNANEYEFRVLENNAKQIIPWRSIFEFYNSTYTSGFGENDSEMAYLGSFSTIWNNYLTVDVRKKGTDVNISSETILWLSHPPKIIATFKPNELNKFLKLFKVRGQKEIIMTNASTKEDSLLRTQTLFASTENNIIFYLEDILNKNVVEYRLQTGNSIGEWRLNDLEFNIVWLKDLKPGKYKLFIRYSTQRHNVSEFDFEIKPAWQQTTMFKIIAGSLIAAFFGFIIALMSIGRHRQKILKEQLKKEKVESEIKAIRSQLNPHFIFNSLSSIQSLINKNDIGNANKYLSRFAKLMRITLHNSNRPFSSMAEEIEILETYLTLEQLRFNFNYEIAVKDNIDATAVEIPSFLTQPLVENAVKHGMEFLKENGIIRIIFTKKEKDLFLIIFDNGKGYEENKSNGYGIDLTRERINLLNRTLFGQFIELEIKGVVNEGTTINILFKNWFA